MCPKFSVSECLGACVSWLEDGGKECWGGGLVYTVYESHSESSHRLNIKRKAYWPATLQMHCTENSKQIFPESKLRSALSQFLHSCICKRFIYSHDRFRKRNTAKNADRSCEYINRFQIHECRNWERGRAVSFLGIFVTHFRCSACCLCSYRKGKVLANRKNSLLYRTDYRPVKAEIIHYSPVQDRLNQPRNETISIYSVCPYLPQFQNLVHATHPWVQQSRKNEKPSFGKKTLVKN